MVHKDSFHFVKAQEVWMWLEDDHRNYSSFKDLLLQNCMRSMAYSLLQEYHS